MPRVSFDDTPVFDVHLPLVIIGSGACGLVAGLAAREAGIEPLLLERDALPRGSTFMSSGFVPTAGTRWQKARGIEDTPAIMAADIERKNHGESDAEIVRTLTEHSAATLEWLADKHGVPFELVEGFRYPGHSHMRMHSTPRRTGEELMGCLLNAAESAGLDILTEAHVSTLHAAADKRVQGVSFVRPDGSEERVGCDALLLACNGFGGNAELVRKFLPELRDAIYHGHPGNQGDALLWGEALGASLKDLHACQGHGSLAWPHRTLISWALMMMGGVQVNRNGDRFSNEHQGYSEQARKVLSQPGQAVWNVFDQRIHRMAMDFEDYRNAVEAGALRSADSIATLAGRLELPPEPLERTFARMHALAASGAADDYGRRFDPDLLLVPPYHAIQVTGALFHTQGGLEIDTRGRVLTKAGTLLPNLYAAGGAARGISGSGDSGYLSGNGLLSAVVMGAIAGHHASQPLSRSNCR